MSASAHLDAELPAERFDRTQWLRLVRYARPHRRAVVQLIACALGTAAMDASYPLLTRRLIDDLAEHGRDAELTGVFVLYGLVTVVLVLCVRGFVRAGGVLRSHAGHDIRRDGFDTLQRLSFSFYDKRPVGWLMARMTSDCERLSNILTWGLLDLVWGGALMLAMAVSMLVLHPTLALAVLTVIPLLAWISVVFQRRILGTARRVRSINSRITASYNEEVQGAATTKTLVREDANAEEFGGLTTGMHGASVSNALWTALFLPLVITVSSVATGTALALGGSHVLVGTLSLGTLVAFMAYITHFFDPLRDLAHWFAEMQMAQASAERLFGLIDERPEVDDHPEVRAALARHGGAALDGEDLPAGSDAGPGSESAAALADGHVHAGSSSGSGSGSESAAALAPDGHPDRLERLAFRGVGFHYVPGQPVLRGIDLTVEAGMTVALVGPTGGGKSTLVSLVTRFYDPTEGAVLAGGVDLRRRSLAWLQARFGIVLQTPHLFSGSVADNIRYGRLDASDAEVRAAARAVGADEVLAALPDGYATEVGEGGDRLSTGQKQLVAFARVVLKDPDVLILDEATASVDTETERRLMAAMDGVLAGRTAFVIAHRLSTVRRADLILVVADGRIEERGTHAELLALRGRYHDLCLRQGLREADYVHAAGG